MNQERSAWLFWLNVVGLCLLVVLLQWNSFTMPFERDEGEYAYSAWVMKEGHVPYRDTFLQKPPMIVYTYLVSQLVNPDAVWPPRALAFVAWLLTALLVGSIVHELYGKRAAWLSLWMYLPMSMLPIFLPYAANTEKFLVLPLLGMFAIRLRHGTGTPTRSWIMAGVLAAIAVLYKQTALVPLVGIFAFWAIDTRKQSTRPSGLARNVLFALGGAVVFTIIAIGYFVYKGAVRDLIECTLTYNFFYAQVTGQRLAFFSSLMTFLAAQWWILVPLAGWYVYRRPARWFEITTILVLTILTASTDINGHYYLLMVPFLVIAASSSLDAFLDFISTNVKDVPRQRWLVTCCSVLVVVVLILPSRGVFGLQPEALSELVYWGNPFVESPIVAEKIRSLTSADDSIFVAGSEPQILFLSKRMSITRFDIMYPLTMPTPFMRKYQDEVKGVLTETPPKVVVFSLTQMSWFYQTTSYPGFRNYVVQILRSGNYAVVGGFMRNGPRKGWVEPLREEEVPLCTLIVLKRKTASL